MGCAACSSTSRRVPDETRAISRPEPTVNLDDCLPAELRGPATTITQITVGFSGAGVYRVDAGGRAFVLKRSAEGHGEAAWRRAVHLQRLAAEAGLAPRIAHVDDGRRAVLSDLVVDRRFSAYAADPATREAAIALLGRTVRRVHQLPIPPDAEPANPRALLETVGSAIASCAAAPAFVVDAVRRARATEAPPAERAPVLSHNDLNPTNLLWDSERLVLLDWDAAAPNDCWFDLAVPALFLRLDDDACRRLLSVYDGVPVATLPARFLHDRWLVAVLLGAGFVLMAVGRGHAGDAALTVDAAPSLADCHARMRAGTMNVGTADGQWAFGLALVREGVSRDAGRVNGG
jgi:thiamine kinase-like enzyme